ncbi:MAG: hypothetical protein RLZZ81_732 [Pseudomonadota bacterium]|jgi:hypothetical protein
MATNLDRLKQEEQKINNLLAHEETNFKGIIDKITDLQNKDEDLKAMLQQEAKLKDLTPSVSGLKKLVNAVTNIKYYFVTHKEPKRENHDLLNKIDQDLVKISKNSEKLENIIAKEIKDCQKKLESKSNKLTDDQKKQFNDIINKFEETIKPKEREQSSTKELENIKLNLLNLTTEHKNKIQGLVELNTEIKKLDANVPKSFFENIRVPFSKIKNIFHNTPIEKFTDGRKEIDKTLNSISQSLTKLEQNLQSSIELKNTGIAEQPPQRVMAEAEEYSLPPFPSFKQPKQQAQLNTELTQAKQKMEPLSQVKTSLTPELSPQHTVVASPPLAPERLSTTIDAPSSSSLKETVQESAIAEPSQSSFSPPPPPPPPPFQNKQPTAVTKTNIKETESKATAAKDATQEGRTALLEQITQGITLAKHEPQKAQGQAEVEASGDIMSALQQAMRAVGAKARDKDKATNETKERDEWAEEEDSFKLKQAKEADDRKKLAEKEAKAKEIELTKKEGIKTEPNIELQVSTSQDASPPLEQANKPKEKSESIKSILVQAFGARRKHMHLDYEDEQELNKSDNKSKSVKPDKKIEPGKLKDLNTSKFAAVANLFNNNVSISKNQSLPK